MFVGNNKIMNTSCVNYPVICSSGFCKHLTITFCVFFSSVSIAHNTPTDFADLSLNELFEEPVEESQDFFKEEINDKWFFSYEYKFKELEGYRIGTRDVSNASILANDLSQIGRFPILPTKITQQAHLFKFRYLVNSNNSVNITLPYLHQSTEHISTVEDYDFFTIDTNGIGDISVSNQRKIWSLGASSLFVSFGLSIPTGSIDEVGDTPRGAGNQQLPYTMQLGSGTLDFPFKATYNWNSSIGVGVSTKLRTGKNDRGYRLGNHYTASVFYRSKLQNSFIHPFAILSYQYLDSIKGRDDEIIIESAENPFPAPITNPDLYGGETARVSIGLKSNKFLDGLRMNVEIGIPVYQDLNGPQPKEKNQVSFVISKEL